MTHRRAQNAIARISAATARPILTATGGMDAVELRHLQIPTHHDPTGWLRWHVLRGVDGQDDHISPDVVGPRVDRVKNDGVPCSLVHA